MQGGPKGYKYTYSAQDVIKFSHIQKLPYEQKQSAVAALTVDERMKYYDFFQNPHNAAYNEAMPKNTDLSKFKPFSSPSSNQGSSSSTSSSSAAALTHSGSQAPLVFSTGLRSSAKLAVIKGSDEEEEAYLASLIASTDLSDDDDIEEKPMTKSKGFRN